MAKLKKWFGILTLINLQILLADKESFGSEVHPPHQQQYSTPTTTQEKKSQLQKSDESEVHKKLSVETIDNCENEMKNIQLLEEETQKTRDFNLKATTPHSSTENKLRLLELDQQFEQFCHTSLPCTCYYPDHTDVVQLELKTDYTTGNTTSEKSNGPTSCHDLQRTGNTLAGFYLVHLNSTTRVRPVYCSFSNRTIQEIEEIRSENQTSVKLNKNVSGMPVQSFSKSSLNSKPIRFCGGVGSHPCAFMYADYPDAFVLDSNPSSYHKSKPTGCQDLKQIGYINRGFYLVHMNSIKIRVVYCDFNVDLKNEIDKILTKDQTSSPGQKRCNMGIGSQPCSCYYHSGPSNTLQIEISTDEITRNALREGMTGTRPASCEDLENYGHTAEGFYIVRVHRNKMKSIYCKFNVKEKEKDRQTSSSLSPTPNPKRKMGKITTATKSVNIQSIFSTLPQTISLIADSEASIKPSVPNLTTKDPNKNSNQISKDTSSSVSPKPTFNQSQKQNDEKVKEDDELKRNFENQIEDPLANWTIDTMDWSKPTKCDGTKYLLKNGHGKCMGVSSSDPKLASQNGTAVVQSDCNPLEKGHLWRWKKNNRLCNDWDKCLSVLNYPYVELWENIDGKVEQAWYFFQNKLYTRGLCVIPRLNSAANEAKMMIEICEPKKQGKSWNFYKEMTEN